MLSTVVSEKVVLVWMVFLGGYSVGRNGGRGVVFVSSSCGGNSVVNNADCIW